MFVIHQPGMVLQSYIIFPSTRPDPLLHVYSTSAWPGFARLYYFPPNQAWPTSACLQSISLTWLCETTLFSHSSGLPAHDCMFIIHRPGPVLRDYIIFPPPGLTHFCMFTIHRPDLVVQGYIIFPLIWPDPLLHVYKTSAWPGVRSSPSEGRGQRQPNNQPQSDCDNARCGSPKLWWVQWTAVLQRGCLVGCQLEWMGTSGLQRCLNAMEGMVEDSSRA